ncbi:MAG: DUF2723 domain-containing protein [Gemmatimonadota bacterium]
MAETTERAAARRTLPRRDPQFEGGGPTAAAAVVRPPRGTRPLMAVAAFAVVLLGYVLTLAPTVTFWDAGEFIAASHVLGIPHPPGTPLFILMGRVAAWLPIGLPVAVKTNLLAAIASALGGMFYFLAITRVLEAWLRERRAGLAPLLAQLGALAAVLVSAFGLTVWQNSTETEVYAMATMTIGLVSWLVALWRERWRTPGADHLLLFVALLMGLSVGMHLMALLCLPAAGLFVAWTLWPERRGFVLSLAGGALGAYLLVLKGFDADAWLAGQGSILNPVSALLGLLVLGVSLFYMVRYRAAAFFGLAALFFLAGTSVFLYLKIRAGLDPAINEADPSTWKSLVEVLLRRQYDVRPPFPRTVDFLQIQVPMYFDYLFGQIGPLRSEVSSQFGGPGALGGLLTLAWVGLGVWGMVEHARADRQSFVYFLLVFLITGLGLVVWLNFRAGYSQAPELTELPREVRERDYFFIVSYALLGLWAGMGAFTLLLRGALARPALAPWAPTAAAALTLAVPAATFALNHHEADRSGNYIARDFAYNVLQSAEPFGIVFTNGDNDTFPLWYAQEVEGIRRDVVVANLSLLNTDWYLEQLSSSPFSATPPERPVSTALSDRGQELAAIDTAGGSQVAAVDTAAYPTAPVLSDAAGLPLYVPVRDPMGLSITAPGSGREIRLEIPAGYLRRQDMAVLKVLGGQLDQRPVYFSVTVPTEAMVQAQPYLTRTGVLYEVNSRPSAEAAASDPALYEIPQRAGLVFDYPRTDALLWDVYRYRGLLEDDVFKDGTTRMLMRNYGYTLLGMSEVYYFNDEPRKARRAFDMAQEFLATERVEAYYANALKLSAAAGDTLAIDSLLAEPDARGKVGLQTLQSAALLAALKEEYDAARAIAAVDVPAATGDSVPREFWVQLGDAALENGDSARAEDFFATSLRGDRDFRLGYLKLVSTAGERGQLFTATAVVEAWVAGHPADTLSARLLEEMKATRSFPDELRWENLRRFFPEADSPSATGAPEAAAGGVP